MIYLTLINIAIFQGIILGLIILKSPLFNSKSNKYLAYLLFALSIILLNYVFELEEVFIKPLFAKLEEKLTEPAFEENEQQELLSIIESMKDGVKQERENIGIDILLNEENAKFYKRLKEKHPDISQTEARFCTLLYLNLDTKEMARILSISLDGVRKSRHRLRKKLNIGTGGDLTNYLQSI